MDLTKDDCTVPASFVGAMTRGFRSMGVENPRVIISRNFITRVAELTGKNSYTSTRGSGAVAAKTVPTSAGSVVLVNYNEVESLKFSNVKRLAAHEAGHILINDRGNEEMTGNRDANDSDSRWILKCIAGQSIVEFRIELRLAELGYPTAEWGTSESIDEELLVFNYEIANAVLDPASSDPRNLLNGVLGALNHATKALGYLAAAMIAGNADFSPSTLSTAGQKNWADYVAPTWDERLDLLSSIPSVTESISTRSWRAILRKNAVLEQQFMLDAGFAFQDEAGGGYGFYRRGSESLFTTRIRRAQQQTRNA